MGTEELLKRVMASSTAASSERPQGPEIKRAAPSAQFAWTIPGIVASTRVLTNLGNVPAHLVRERDWLRNHLGNYVQIKRIHIHRLDGDFLRLHPSSQPVVIGQRTLGRKLPSHEIQLSPAQRLVDPLDWGTSKRVRADDLSTLRCCFDLKSDVVSYYAFDVGEPSLLECEGLRIESFSNAS